MSDLSFDIELDSLSFDNPIFEACETYQVTTIDAVARREIGTSGEPNPEKTPIIWAAKSEVVEIDKELKTATVKVWFN